VTYRWSAPSKRAMSGLFGLSISITTSRIWTSTTQLRFAGTISQTISRSSTKTTSSASNLKTKSKSISGHPQRSELSFPTATKLTAHGTCSTTKPSSFNLTTVRDSWPTSDTTSRTSSSPLKWRPIPESISTWSVTRLWLASSRSPMDMMSSRKPKCSASTVYWTKAHP